MSAAGHIPDCAAAVRDGCPFEFVLHVSHRMWPWFKQSSRAGHVCRFTAESRCRRCRCRLLYTRDLNLRGRSHRIYGAHNISWARQGSRMRDEIPVKFSRKPPTGGLLAGAQRDARTGVQRVQILGEYTLDPKRGCLLRAGEPVHLRPQSYEVLRYLADNPGRLISKEELIGEVWRGRAVTDDSIVQCLRDVRLALGAATGRCIRTVRGRGYILETEGSPNAASLCPDPAPPGASEPDVSATPAFQWSELPRGVSAASDQSHSTASRRWHRWGFAFLVLAF